MESHKPLLFWDVFKNTVLWQQGKSSVKCNRPLPLTCQGKIFRHKLQFANSTRCQARSLGPVMGCLCWWLCARFPKCRTQTGIRLAIALCWEDRMLPSACVQGLTRSQELFAATAAVTATWQPAISAFGSSASAACKNPRLSCSYSRT